MIAKNTSLIVARVPLTIQQKRSWDRNETLSFNNLKDEANLGRAVDLTRLDGSEEDKIRAMMTQSTQDYDPSKYMILYILLFMGYNLLLDLFLYKVYSSFI